MVRVTHDDEWRPKTHWTAEECDLNWNDPTFDEVALRLEEAPDPPVNLWRALSGLTPKQRFVIDLRYGIGGNGQHTQDETASFMGISRQAVSRIEERALNRLRSGAVY